MEKEKEKITKNQKEHAIHWFPGHMKKASNKIEESIKLVDFVIVLLDARAPLSSSSEYLISLTREKQKLFIMTKNDLADEKITRGWQDYFSKGKDRVLSLDLKAADSKKLILNEIHTILKDKKDKYSKKGIVNFTYKAMVVGIPNVGKSTFINMVANKAITKTANTPGLTRKNRWVKIDANLELMDTPGILEPSYKDKQVAINLALIGAIKATILPTEELANYALDYLKENYLNILNSKYNLNVEKITAGHEVFEQIAKKRGYLLKGQFYDLDKAQILLLNDFKNGQFGRISVEKAD